MLRSPGYGSIDAILLGADSSDTQILFNDSATIAGSAKLTFTTATGQVINAQGTLTASAPFTLTQTWNAAVDFNALLVNVTSTSSNAASTLLDLQVGGSSKLSVRKDGALQFGSTDFAKIILADTGLRFYDGGVGALYYAFGALNVGLGYTIGFSPSGTPGNDADIRFHRDAAATLAQRNGTTAQKSRLYANYVSSTDYHRLELATAKTTLSGVSGASVTATGLIPDGAFYIGITTKVTTGLGATGGTTGYQVGDGSDVDRWGEASTITAGTTTDNTNATANPTGAATAASDVVITAVGGNFDGTGVIDVCVFYLIAQAD